MALSMASLWRCRLNLSTSTTGTEEKVEVGVEEGRMGVEEGRVGVAAMALQHPAAL